MTSVPSPKLASGDGPAVTAAESRQGLVWLAATGAVLLVIQGLLLAISPRFEPAMALSARPIVPLSGLLAFGGLVLLAGARPIVRLPPSTAVLIIVVLVGVTLRLLAASAIPMVEDDFHRYLWDGAVLAAGHDPYAVAPAAAAETPHLRGLVEAAGLTWRRINYPDLTTVYPPLAEALFALSHWLVPWSLTAWRGVLFAADLATLGLLFAVLRQLDRSPLWLILYWWNPLAIQQTMNAAHMDALILPPLLVGVALMIARRPVGATAALVVAAGIKLWPVLLLPAALRPLLDRPGRLAVVLVLVAVALTAIVYPMRDSSGLAAFTADWRANEGLFAALSLALSWLGDDGGARLAAALVVAALAFALNWSATDQPTEIVARCFWVVAALFLLSPTQFPWYFTWLLPMLVLAPRLSLLGYTVLLPIYYLRFHFDARGQAAVFDHWLVWLQHGPVLIMLILEWRWRRFGSWRHA